MKQMNSCLESLQRRHYWRSVAFWGSVRELSGLISTGISIIKAEVALVVSVAVVVAARAWWAQQGGEAIEREGRTRRYTAGRPHR
jgi:hypothetical protein